MKTKAVTPKSGLARLMELAGSKKSQLSAACVLSVIASAARLVPFFTIYALLRQILFHFKNLSEISTETIALLVGITAIAALVYGLLSFLSSSLSHRAAYNILYELRVALMEKLSRLPSGYFSHNTQGKLKKVMQDDVEKIEEFVAHTIADTAAAISLPIFTIIYLAVMDWRLALLTLLPLLVAMGLLSRGLKNPKGAQTQMAMHSTRSTMNSTIVEYLQGMPVVKVFNRSLSAFRRLGESIENYSGAVKDATYFFAPSMGLYYVAMGAQLLLILPAGLWMALRASSYLDFLPLLFLFFLVGAGLKEPLENMMSMGMSTRSIALGLQNIDNILGEKEIAQPLHPQTPQNHNIRFDDVLFSYDEEGAAALEHLSFELKENSITGLVGPSGSGKSTIAQLLLHFYEVQAGSISIGGVKLQDIPSASLVDLIGYVFQDSVIFKDTVEANIRMGKREASFQQVEEAAKAAGIHELILTLPKAYQTVIGGDNNYLSGGEKQRLAIARVFLKNPPIILLDEATAYADAENESIIQESFARLSEGKTVLIIAHRLKTVENADKILVMGHGKLLASGTHKELLAKSPAYQAMLEAYQSRDEWRIQKTRESEESV